MLKDIKSFWEDHPIASVYIALGLIVYFIELINTYIAYM